MDYKVIIAGGRLFNNYELLKDKCDYYLSNKLRTHNVIIVSGMAPGADTLGMQYATEKNLSVEPHPAKWEKHGRAAGPIRNEEMAACSDALIAFWDGVSRGTKSMIDLARSYGLQVAIVRYDIHTPLDGT